MTLPNFCVILHNHVFDRFDIYDASGTSVWHSDSHKQLGFFDCLFAIRNLGMKEVPLNSREGQRIVNRIGMFDKY